MGQMVASLSFVAAHRSITHHRLRPRRLFQRMAQGISDKKESGSSEDSGSETSPNSAQQALMGWSPLLKAAALPIVAMLVFYLFFQ